MSIVQHCSMDGCKRSGTAYCCCRQPAARLCKDHAVAHLKNSGQHELKQLWRRPLQAECDRLRHNLCQVELAIQELQQQLETPHTIITRLVDWVTWPLQTNRTDLFIRLECLSKYLKTLLEREVYPNDHSDPLTQAVLSLKLYSSQILPRKTSYKLHAVIFVMVLVFCVNYSAVEEPGKPVKTSEGWYTGDWKDGSFHGFGTLEYFDGRRYSGDWMNGVPHGNGAYQELNSKYLGEFRNGFRHGQGALYVKEELEFSGEWSNGVKHGQGTDYRSRFGEIGGTWLNGEWRWDAWI